MTAYPLGVIVVVMMTAAVDKEYAISPARRFPPQHNVRPVPAQARSEYGLVFNRMHFILEPKVCLTFKYRKFYTYFFDTKHAF